MYKLKPVVADDVIPLSVADMEFKNLPEVIDVNALNVSDKSLASFGNLRMFDF